MKLSEYNLELKFKCAFILLIVFYFGEMKINKNQTTFFFINNASNSGFANFIFNINFTLKKKKEREKVKKKINTLGS